MTRLGTATKTALERVGYAVVPGVLTPDLDLRPLVDELDGVLDGIAESLVGEGALRDRYRGLPFESRLIRVCQESGRNFPQAFDFSLPQTGVRHDTPMYLGAAAFRVLTHPRLLDVVEEVIGPEIASNPVQHVRIKLPGRAVQQGLESSLVTKVPWHQDNGVILPEADEATILTVWIPVNEATVENGCLQVIPRSHGGEVEPHCGEGNLQIPERFVPTARALPLPMEPGSVLLMTQRTIHSSLENVTRDGVRISLDLRYQPVGQPTGRPAFAPAGFVARSAAHPEQVLRDPAVWARNWIELRDRLAEGENPRFNRWSPDSPACA